MSTGLIKVGMSAARRTVIATTRAQRWNSSTTFNPLRPDVKVDELGLPVDPQVSPSTARYYNPSPVDLTREQLHKLHKLSALKPPQEGSPEETKLMEELGGLIGLMDVVKEVSLPQDPKELAELLKGFGQSEQVFDGTNMTREKPTSTSMLKGRELLKYAAKSERGLYVFKSK
jgi:Asp-tRNA(Asn)/Glu-tRNA(Gln) amidotransferase C subunit